jgi:hypothetical protein
MRRYHFVSARWFRLPMKVTVIAVSVFALLSLYPSLINGDAGEQRKALLGLLVLLGFVGLGVTFTVLIDDGHVEIGPESLHIRFESFIHFEVPLAAIVAARRIDPRPRWRYRFGLSTDWRDRIACSHGGGLVEIELAHQHEIKLWPRVVPMRRLWLGVREQEAFLESIQRLLQREGAKAA